MLISIVQLSSHCIPQIVRWSKCFPVWLVWCRRVLLFLVLFYLFFNEILRTVAMQLVLTVLDMAARCCRMCSTAVLERWSATRRCQHLGRRVGAVQLWGRGKAKARYHVVYQRSTYFVWVFLTLLPLQVGKVPNLCLLIQLVTYTLNEPTLSVLFIHVWQIRPDISKH